MLHSCKDVTGFSSLLRLALLSSVFSGASAYAAPIVWATGPNNITPGGGAALEINVQATLTFNVSAHTIAIQLLNLEANPNSVPQLLAGVEIDFANLASGTLSGSVASFSGSSFSIDGTGTPTAAPTPITSTTWQIGSAGNTPTAGYGANTLALCEICKFGGNGPAELIIGGPIPSTAATTDKYGTKGGLTTTPHQPYILGSGATYSAGATFAGANSMPTWTINVPLLQASTTITAVHFYFGSAYDLTQEYDGTLELPEPSGMGLVAGGVLLLAVRLRRIRYQKARNV